MIEHPYGTYAEAAVSAKTKKELLDFIKKNNIVNPVKTFHCTLVYSKESCPGIKAIKLPLPVTASVTEFKLFDYKRKKCLVLVLDSPELNRYHYDANEQYNASYDYLEYIPHITLSYDFTGPIPPVPDIRPVFNKLTVKALSRQF